MSVLTQLTTWFGLGAAGMTIGTLLFLSGLVSADSNSRKYYVTLVAISGIAAVAYTLMALEIGWQPVGDDRLVFLPRYIDWLLTTPLLILYLAFLADAGRTMIGKLVVANVLVIVPGMVAALLPGVERYALFALGGLAFVYLVYLLVRPLTEMVRELQTESLFLSLRNLTVILWSVYPIIWLLGPPGVDLLTETVDVMLIVYLDLITKVGFGLIALNARAVLSTELGEEVEAELTEDAEADAVTS
jgi:sensory rhodopsin